MASLLPHEIWLCGHICSGKDYIGNVLALRLGFFHMGIGELVAREIEELEGLPYGTIYGTPGMKDKYRQKLQDYGNERRKMSPLYWISRWCLERDLRPERPAVQTSMRFFRESEVARRRNALLVRVAVPEELRQERIRQCYPNYVPAMELNITESEIDSIPCHVEISGDIPQDKIISTLTDIYRTWRDECGMFEPAVR